MNEATLKEVVAELRTDIVGRKLGKFFVLGDSAFAVDLRPHDGRYLFVSALPAQPRLFLFKRSVKLLNKLKDGPTNFADFLRKRVSASIITDVIKEESDRVVRILLENSGEYGEVLRFRLIIQLTGRSSNVFLTDHDGIILVAMRRPHGDGQSPGEQYRCPLKKSESQNYKSDQVLTKPIEGSISEGLDVYYENKRRADQFNSLASNARSQLNNKIKKGKRLLKKLEKDLKKHGQPEKWKRLGDLIKANIGTAKRVGDTVRVIDYFDESLPEIEIEIERTIELSNAAEKYFKKYSKSLSAQTEIAKRIESTEEEIEKLESKKSDLEKAIEAGDSSSLAAFVTKRKAPGKLKKESGQRKLAHEYVSSDGLSILVGKRSKDNDKLTFKVAKSLDVWLHAADYPGSHVIIRKKTKGDIPEKTLIEAAKLAAFYSKAREEGKAAVNYTERKHVNKPKGAAPGLVSLTSFKTIIVEPEVPLKKTIEE